MARPFQAQDQIEAALACIESTKSLAQLRRAQAVVLPLRYGLTLEQTAEAVGLSKSWVSKIRNAFVAKKRRRIAATGWAAAAKFFA